MKLKCIKNSAKVLPYIPGLEYDAEDIGGVLKVFDHEGGFILAPVSGHLLEFETVHKKKS